MQDVNTGGGGVKDEQDAPYNSLQLHFHLLKVEKEGGGRGERRREGERAGVGEGEEETEALKAKDGELCFVCISIQDCDELNSVHCCKLLGN